MTSPLSLIPQEDFKNSNSGKFAPKLNEEERCSVMALVQSGVKRERVAVAFNIDRRTVGHIVNEQSVRYRSVRKKYRALGHDDFVAKYLTESVALKVAALPREIEAPKPAGGISPRANRLAGRHTVHPDQCGYDHHVEIKYHDEGEAGPGWYYRDEDSKAPDTWFHNGAASLATSQACYDALLENLLD